jgi:hypothetical protein
MTWSTSIYAAHRWRLCTEFGDRHFEKSRAVFTQIELEFIVYMTALRLILA